MQVNKNKKLHMFQKNDNLQERAQMEDGDIESFLETNLAKISQSYHSYNQNGKEVLTESLVDSAKGLIETSTDDLSKPLTLFIDQLKEKFTINIPTYEVPTEPIMTTKEEETIENPQEKSVNIDHLLKTSEKELLKQSDQKSTLMNLIDDISTSSTSKTSYDENQFKKNIQEMLEDEDEENTIEEQKDIRLKPFIYGLVIVLLIAASGYVYQDSIIQFFKQLNFMK